MLKISAVALLGFSTFSVGNGEKISGCYIVSFKNNDGVKGSSGSSGINSQALMAQANVKASANSFGNITAEYDHALSGFTVCGIKSESQLDSIRSNAYVASVEQDQVVRANAFRSVDALSWGLDRIDQRSPSLDGTYTYDDTAAPVNVYVLDTGILTSHSQFEGRAFAGYNFVDNNADSTDCDGHGTHCAGTIGAKDYGVCKFCRLIAVKVLDCSGSGSYSGVIAGINWAINHAQSTGNPSVISMSLGGGYSASLNNAVANAVNSGIVTVVSAGNANQNACKYSPASTPSAITVGAISKSSSRSLYSNFGSCLDIFAPGDDIISTWIDSNTALNSLSGTSMAAPHVAGVAAVYRSFNPTKSATEVRNFLVDRISTLGVISGLDANSPNRLLYSRIDNQDQTDRTLAPTMSPTRSPPPTASPTTLSPTTQNPTTLSPTILDSFVKGHIDGFVSSSTGGNLFGWACSYGIFQSIYVHVYVGGGYGQGTFLKVGYADSTSEDAVSAACGTSGISHRFSIPLTFAEIGSLNGKKLFIHGISAVPELPNLLLSNSGTFPEFSVKGYVDAFASSSSGGNLFGWACSYGIAQSIYVHLYAGGAFGQGTFLKAGYANATSESAVSAVCGTSGVSHRYSIPFTSAEIKSLNGKKLFVHGISAISGWPNLLLSNSGAFP
jgi:subtilisin family serine protease/fructose-specific component phosphotransferase system IIB-like protein